MLPKISHFQQQQHSISSARRERQVSLQPVSSNLYDKDYLQRKQSSQKVAHHSSSAKVKHPKKQKIETQIQNQHLDNLINNLYPKLAAIRKDLKRHPSLDRLCKSKELRGKRMDQSTSSKILQNRVLLTTAQKELEKRMKSRLPQKTKYLSDNIQETYHQVYKRLSTQKNQLKVEELNIKELSYEQPLTSPEGINYYSEISKRPALLTFTKEKLRRKSQQNNPNLTGVTKNVLRILQSRKKRQNQLTLQLSDVVRQDNKNKEDLNNFSQISNRLKKVYSKQNQKRLNDKSKRKIEQSLILKHQEKILEKLSKREAYCSSKKNKIQLLSRFNSILAEFAQSPSPEDNQNRTAKLRKINSRMNSFSIDTGRISFEQTTKNDMSQSILIQKNTINTTVS